MGLHLRGITGSTVEDGLEEKGQLKSSWDENDEIMNLANGGGGVPYKEGGDICELRIGRTL